MSEGPDISDVDRWLAVIKAYDAEFKPWNGRVTKILKRYRDDARTATGNETARFNILWSNVQTLVPAVYAKLPKADVTRRFSDNDPVGRVASLLIERALDYEIEHYPDFRAMMKNAVEDRFLGGRGVGWVRYDPHIKTQDTPEDGVQITEDVENEGDTANMTGGQEGVPEEIDYECAPSDYVHWKDFGHSSARTWEEVTAVWRWVYMSREALEERFGEEKAKLVPIDTSPEMLTKTGMASRINDRAKICEYWDRDAGEAVWFHDSMKEPLDRKPDPLGLEGFFPCGKPLYATTTSDNLIPVPDFTLYQDQAAELDILSDRIDGLIKALRVRGVYDASVPALQRLLSEGDNNTLIPVEQWGALSEKGGLKGAIDLLPLDVIAAALIQCYEAQENVKQQIYEITGISDIVRGQGQASETATAQRIKGQYAGLRLQSMQETVALFATEILRIKAQIICTKFQPQTILAYAAAQQMSEADQQLIPQAMELIKNKPLRTFRVEVAADSLVQIDADQQKQDRIEFITALGGFLKEAIPAGQASPELLPMLMESLKFVVSGFKQARSMEGTIDVALQKLEQAAQAAAGQPKPDPEMAKVQAQAQADQQKMQAQQAADREKLAADRENDQAKLQAEQMKWAAEQTMQKQKLDYEHALNLEKARMEAELEKWKAQLQADTAITVARIGANPGEDVPQMEAVNSAMADLVEKLGGHLDEATTAFTDAQREMQDRHAEAMQQVQGVLEAAKAPKRIVRGPDGRAVAIEHVKEAA